MCLHIAFKLSFIIMRLILLFLCRDYNVSQYLAGWLLGCFFFPFLAFDNIICAAQAPRGETQVKDKILTIRATFSLIYDKTSFSSFVNLYFFRYEYAYVGLRK